MLKHDNAYLLRNLDHFIHRIIEVKYLDHLKGERMISSLGPARNGEHLESLSPMTTALSAIYARTLMGVGLTHGACLY